MSIWAPLALTASTGSLLALPLTPAVLELVRKRDAGPLATRKDDGNIRNFADSFRAYAAKIDSVIAQSGLRGGVHKLQDSTRFLLLDEELLDSGASRSDLLTVTLSDIDLPHGFVAVNDFHARGALRTGTECIFRALLGDGDIHLGRASQVLRWAHAEKTFRADGDCKLLGRLSAGESIVLTPGCEFERMKALAIFTAQSTMDALSRSRAPYVSGLRKVSFGRHRASGRIHLSAGEEVYGDIVTTDEVEIGRRAYVVGSIKGHGDVSLEPGSEVAGSVVSMRSVYVGEGCFARGPLIAEDEIVISSGAQIGLPHTPATISAPRIRIAPGCIVHGSVWARSGGSVSS
jgi:hypothetical protein